MKVLLVGDSPIHHTGTAKVMDQLGRGLASCGWEVGHVGHNHNGLPTDYPAPIWPWQRADNDGLLRAAKDFAPDRILCFGDSFFYPTLMVARREMQGWVRPPSLYLYLTVDAAPFPTGLLNLAMLDAADQIACTTQFGCDVLGGTARCDVATPIRTKYTARHIPLGVDPAVYCDLPRPEKAWPVIGWSGMNQPRKHPDLMLDLLRRLKEGPEPHPQLWMKTEANGTGAFFDLPRIAEHQSFEIQLGPCERGHLPSRDVDVWFHTDWLPEAEMARFYRFCDVFLSTASAGAPELPIIEAAACGTPTVALDCGSFPEVADYLAAPRGGDWVSFEVRHPRVDLETMEQAVRIALDGGPSVKRPGAWAATVAGVDAMLREPVADWLEGVVV